MSRRPGSGSNLTGSGVGVNNTMSNNNNNNNNNNIINVNSSVINTGSNVTSPTSSGRTTPSTGNVANRLTTSNTNIYAHEPTNIDPSSLASMQVLFCVNPVMFEHCGILLDTPSDLTIAAVMKLREETITSTAISLASWKDIAVNKLGLREVIAYGIFDVFFAMSGGCVQNTPSFYNSYKNLNSSEAESGSVNGKLVVKSCATLRQESNRALLDKMGGSVDESRWPLASTSRHVSLPGLVLFLLTQIMLARPPRQPLGAMDSELVVRNLQLNLLDYVNAVAVTRPGRLTFADALELRYLLREFVNGVEQPFGTSLALLWPKNEKTIDIAVLPQFIRPRIVLPSEIAMSVPHPIHVDQGVLSAITLTGGAFANNVVIHDLHDTVYIPPSSSLLNESACTFHATSYTIAQCTQTAFYIAAPLPHTRLSLLRNCTVTMGPVGGVLCVDRCEDCTISALCASVIVSSCRNVNLCVCTNTPPVLCMDNSIHTAIANNNTNTNTNTATKSTTSSLYNVRFGPYNSFYSTLEEHLVLTGVNPKMNLWNVGLPSTAFILPPEEFTPVCFPIAPLASVNFTTHSNPCSLPQPYVDALNRRLRRFQDVSQNLHDAYSKLEESGHHKEAENLRTAVHKMFIQWLNESGQANGLLNLLHQSAEKEQRQ